jgi:hypothetical protein
MEDSDFCVKCGHFPKQDDNAMYPDFCRECADRIKNLLDKAGILNKLKRKLKVK